MARYRGPKCRKCRYLGLSVCGSERCALNRRETRPGMHPYIRRGANDYRVRLLEKQKLRFSYWVSERQLREYAKKAFQRQGATGENLLALLERRLDVLVYRIGFAPTIPAARQIMVHGHIEVNGRKVDRPSYLVRQEERISVRGKSRKIVPVQDGLTRSEAWPSLPYLDVDRDTLQAKLVSIPGRKQIPMNIDDRLVVEYYRRYL